MCYDLCLPIGRGAWDSGICSDLCLPIGRGAWDSGICSDFFCLPIDRDAWRGGAGAGARASRERAGVQCAGWGVGSAGGGQRGGGYLLKTVPRGGFNRKIVSTYEPKASENCPSTPIPIRTSRTIVIWSLAYRRFQVLGHSQCVKDTHPCSLTGSLVQEPMMFRVQDEEGEEDDFDEMDDPEVQRALKQLANATEETKK
eukprot:1179476-Prorocentrum_minimum.AAC.1